MDEYVDEFREAIEAANYIRTQIGFKPDLAVILGSGLGGLAYEVQNPTVLDYKEIPYFKTSTVQGHAGKLICGTIYDKKVVVMQGRLHYYEGYSMKEVVFPVRVFACLGVEGIIITNAAGGINPAFKPGDLMLITDHLNMSFDSPLRGENEYNLGPRFPSMRRAYTPQFIDLAKKVAKELKIDVKEGVYAFMPGPQYETAAEIRMLSTLGASAVGMSTVPEVIAAAHSSMDVLGISCITNTTGTDVIEIDHDEVLDVTSKIENNFCALVKDIIREVPKAND